MSKNFTNSINQRNNTEEQNPIKIKSSANINMSMVLQKVPQQNFGAYQDPWCSHRPQFGSFYR
jgi:hypothetical protein